jgi:ABC-type amino acid transport substrate-binding protein
MKKILIGLSVLIMLMALGCQGKTSNADQNVLILGTSADFEPFEFVNGQGEIVGFDIDIAKEIAAAQGKRLEIMNLPFTDLFSSLDSGRIDIVISAISRTPERAAMADLSEPYYSSRMALLVPVNSPVASESDLMGKNIGVQTSDTGEAVAPSLAGPEGNVFKYIDTADAVRALENGNIDAVLLNEKPLMAYAQQNPRLKVIPLSLQQEEYVIAVRKGNAALLSAVNNTIRELHTTGAYTQLAGRWLNE